ncbi:hypothetical protein [Patulibacter minatonensis]|uniref:hypothetical protein n=1 Tax=Patulibacter minatonensis TaxID=298163 RepID=UPI000478D311|nr:hypothetical protein [Patulibacter minatonensis]
MPRQRLGLPHGILTTIGQKLMVLLGLALVWGGGVVLALAAGAAPRDVDAWTGYRTVQREIGGFGPANWPDGTALAIAVGTVVLAVALLVLGWAQRLTPHLARTDVVLADRPEGRTTVSPRAIERAAEVAARREPGLHAVRARLGDDELTITVHARGADVLPELLRGVQRRATAALVEGGVPQQSVRVVVTRFTAPSAREQLR